ncbi:MAG: CD0415/CD1112 family protein [Parvimonas sp.]|uniref:VirB6/TrbL-like conjugal transfer protein, CD1112 family n=1 Tax=Parvimonas sp. TaxID=1944660 RepID=UPI0025E86C20|nr:CD0415/CD1112 family protein [Parvimonas sp.]MCI5997043.1 CD0415/CD1112 family protein [Parvimonas sp.]
MLGVKLYSVIFVFNIVEKLQKAFKDVLLNGVEYILKDMFSLLNDKLLGAADTLATSPDKWNEGIFTFMKNISETVVLPVAGLVLAAFFCIELIQMMLEKNNLQDVELSSFFKLFIKLYITGVVVTNSLKFFMIAFKIIQSIIEKSLPLLNKTSTLDESQVNTIIDTLKQNAGIGQLLILMLELQILKLFIWIIAITIEVIIYGRMIEIYLVGTVAPIPFATIGMRQNLNFGVNYLKIAGALALQGFLMLVCISIFSVLIKTIDYTKAVYAIWSIFGYGILLIFTMIKTGSLAKSILN